MSANTQDKLSAYFPGLVDVCQDQDGQPVYLVSKDNRLSLAETMSLETGEVAPPPLENLPFTLPRASKVLKYAGREDPTLYQDLLAYLQRFSALDETQWAVVAHYVFLTYLHDHPDIDYCPYILFYAVPERGKSRTGKSVAYVAFRGVHLIEMREPSIFRYSQNLRGTLFFDLMDVWKKAERSGCEDILLLRAEKGAKCARILYPERGAFKDTVYYDIYGPTIIASNEQLHKILETRCLPIVMPNRPGNYENPRPQLAQSLKERLTAWRARTLHGPLSDLSPIDGISGRLWDISRPLFQVGQLVQPQASGLLLEAINTISGERNDSKRETAEGRLVAIIKELTDKQGAADYLDWTLKTADIWRAFNENRSEDRHVSAQWIGKKLKSMSLRRRTVQGRSEILLSSREYQTLLEQYGCISRVPALPPQTLPEKTMEIQQDVGVVGSCRVSREMRTLDEFDRELFEEKAALLQFEAGLPREEAEKEAAKWLREVREKSDGSK